MTAKTTLKEKIKTGLMVTAVLASGAALGGVMYATITYSKLVRTVTLPMPNCTIVELTGGDFSLAKYVTPKGEIGTAGISSDLERTVSARLYGEHKATPAVLERTIYVYRTMWGKGPEVSDSYEHVKSLAIPK